MPDGSIRRHLTISPSPFYSWLFALVKSRFLVFDWPGWLLQLGSWMLITLFATWAIGEFRYIGFFKKVKSSKFARPDTKYYAPLCVLIMALLCCLEFLN
jgi:hypothetical protein